MGALLQKSETLRHFWQSLQFYLDGQPERARFYEPPSAEVIAMNPITGTTDALPLTIGRSRSNPANSCTALLDELYIFESELSHPSVRVLTNL